MFLDSTLKSLELVLGSAVTTTAMPITVDYVDLTPTTTVAGASDTQSNGLTAVTILSAPAASTTRKVNGISVYNADSVAKIVTVRLNNNATLRILVSVTLQVGDTLVYTDVNGWYSLDSSGSIKEVASGTLFGNITIAGIETDTAVGTQKVISQDASKFREGQQSTLTSGTAYSSNGNLLVMKSFTHNFGIDTSGNLTTADATDYCTSIFYSEDDKLKGFSSAAPVTGGTTPTISNTWYVDNISGSLSLTGTQSRIIGDFSNATVSSRLSFQTNTTNSFTTVNILPNGTSQATALNCFNTADPTNSSASSIQSSATDVSLKSIVTGSGTYLPLNIYNSNTIQIQIPTAGGLYVMQPTGLGYGTGSGGTVTQATSKSTTVTLNKPTGQITMNNAALGGNTSVQFTFTNSLIGSADILDVMLNWNSSYSVRCVAVSAGSAAIVLTNITAGSLSDAVLLNFQIHKGATA